MLQILIRRWLREEWLPAILLALLPLGFVARRAEMPQTVSPLPLNRPLAVVSLAGYPFFMGFVNAGLAVPAAALVIAAFALAFRPVLRGLDWPLLLVFVLMFVGLGLLARLPAIAKIVPAALDLRGGAFMPSIIERLWRSLKDECVHLNAFETGSGARAGIGKWITYYNTERPHSALGGRTPLEAHRDGEGHRLAA